MNGSEREQAMARVIHEAMTRLKTPYDVDQLINRIKLLELGLPAEDEVSFLVNSFGRCRLVHKLDQLQVPRASRRDYRVPDLLVVFDYKGEALPVLVEVKHSRQPHLSWRDDYMCSLVRYSTMLNLPLLIAWKCHGLWMLFEFGNFAPSGSRWRIDLNLAMKQNLLGILAGDFFLDLEPGVGLHFVMRKEQILEEIRTSEHTTEQHWRIVVEDAYWTNGRGERMDTDNLLGSLMCFFLALDPEDQGAVDDTHIRQSFVVSKEQTSCFAHRAFVSALQFIGAVDDQTRWRRVLEQEIQPVSYADVRSAAEQGTRNGTVRYVMDQVPRDLPEFLTARK